MATKKTAETGTAVTEAKRTRKDHPEKNLPSQKFEPKTEADRNYVSETILWLNELRNKPPVKSNDELTERLNDYFMSCAERKRTPTIESLCLCCGYSPGQVTDWKNKRFVPMWGDTFTHEILKKAWDLTHAFDAELVLSGKINVAAYIFRAKNYHGMVDEQKMTIEPNNPLGEAMSEKSLTERYSQGIDTSDYEDKT